jgi:hypothetical protein
MIKRVQEINLNPLSTPITIKKLKPLLEQPNYNPRLREWFGPKEWDIVAETRGIFEAFKESEDWREIGMLETHDYKVTVNDSIQFDTVECIVERPDTGQIFEIVFKREYIGEFVIGLRPVKP